MGTESDVRQAVCCGQREGPPARRWEVEGSFNSVTDRFPGVSDHVLPVCTVTLHPSNTCRCLVLSERMDALASISQLRKSRASLAGWPPRQQEVWACGGCSCRAVVSPAPCREGAKVHVQACFQAKSKRVRVLPVMF